MINANLGNVQSVGPCQSTDSVDVAAEGRVGARGKVCAIAQFRRDEGSVEKQACLAHKLGDEDDIGEPIRVPEGIIAVRARAGCRTACIQTRDVGEVTRKPIRHGRRDSCSQRRALHKLFCAF